MAANNMERGEVSADVPLLPKNPDEIRKLFRREFTLVAWTFGINHAAVSTPHLYVSSVLTESSGQYSSSVLDASTLVCSLFFAMPVFVLLGARRGLALAMGLSSIYAFLFAMSSSMCSKFNLDGICVAGESGQFPTALSGAVLGGLGAGALWTCQGAFFAAVCERLAEAEQREKSEVTVELAASFAAIYLSVESFFRASATLLNNYCGLRFSLVFYIFAGIAIASTVTFMVLSSTDQKKTEPLQVSQFL